MNDDLKQFVKENLDLAFVEYKKALANATKNILEGYIQAMEEVLEFIESEQ